MTRPFTDKILTANHLQTGDAIYWAADGWSRDVAAATVLRDANSAEQALTRATNQPQTAVGPYLAEAALTADGSPYPTHFREVFRTKGPSNYHHGKQEQAHV